MFKMSGKCYCIAYCVLRSLQLVLNTPIGEKRMSKNKVKVGVIGCGNISSAYCTGMSLFNIIEIVACADVGLKNGPLNLISLRSVRLKNY